MRFTKPRYRAAELWHYLKTEFGVFQVKHGSKSSNAKANAKSIIPILVGNDRRSWFKVQLEKDYLLIPPEDCKFGYRLAKGLWEIVPL